MPDQKRAPLLMRQKPMHNVLLASVPCILGSIYFYGWRSLALVVTSCIVAFFAEYMFTRPANKPVSEAAFVTAVLYALVVPPTIPWHVHITGIPTICHCIWN